MKNFQIFKNIIFIRKFEYIIIKKSNFENFSAFQYSKEKNILILNQMKKKRELNFMKKILDNYLKKSLKQLWNFLISSIYKMDNETFLKKFL